VPFVVPVRASALEVHGKRARYAGQYAAASRLVNAGARGSAVIEGNNGHEYLLGFGPAQSPIFSCRKADGTFEPLHEERRASEVAIKQIGHTGGLIGPGMGTNTWLWGGFREALKAFPPIPTWPRWSGLD
jgi:hypothetical protein